MQLARKTTPPFRADHVGSMLRPEKLKQARRRQESGEITKEALRELENEEIKRIVEKQKEIGLQSVTDGEFRRAYWHFDFLENLTGVQGYESGGGIQFKENQTKSHSIRIIGDLDFSGHPMIDDYKFLHSIAGDHTPKMTIPSPSMLHFRGKIAYGRYQADEDLFFHDLGKAYKKSDCRFLRCRLPLFAAR